MKQQLLVKYSNVPKQSFCEKLLRKKPDSESQERSIVANIPDPEIGTNKISTSKYNLISFPIFNLFEQFTKPSNIYFLIIGVLQMIPAISVSEGKPTMFFPLTMVVLISMIKDFFEDWKRRKSDKMENQSQIEVLNELGWTKTKWQNILVGDIIRVNKDEYFPCDVLLLKHSLQARVVYVQTKNLDGETNLKLKKVPQSLTFLQKQPETEIEGMHIEICYEKPNQFINSFNGNVKFKDKKYPLQNTNVILRGCSLKINSQAIGLCLYNGHETKIMQNSSHAVPKRSSLQKTLNKYFKFVCVFQILVTLLFSLIYGGIVSNKYDYLGYINESPYFFMDVISDWGSWFISISNLIPISLLVTVELVRYGQGWVIMNRSESQEAIEVQTSSVNEELGQIEYVLSDKTGTLTQNLMEFKCVLIDNQNYGYISYEEELERARNRKGSMLSEDEQIHIDMENLKQLEQHIQNLNLGDIKLSKENSRMVLSNPQKMQPEKLAKLNELLENAKIKYVDFSNDEKERLIFDLKSGFTSDAGLSFSQNRAHNVLLHLSLCHNVIKENKGYSSSSPDQLALVSFAKTMGYEFIEKNDDGQMIVEIKKDLISNMKIGFSEDQETLSLTYKLLHILEFTSDRKRMSVIVKDQRNNEIFLITKGADDVMIDRASESQISETYKHELNECLYTYASQGLRTLVLGYKRLGIQQFEEWDQKYHEAVTHIGSDRMQRIYELQNAIQKNLLIIGATAIQDKLQNEVRQTICELKKAGMKVWMLTGDKKQTAVSIGYSCGLISEQCEKITLDCQPEHAQNLIANVNSLIELGFLKGEKVVVISGEIMKKIKQSTKAKLAQLLQQASSVICCRVSPKDKETLTRMVMDWGRTLAVGDGANDVNMINAANIGVGVRGIEGSQATRAADYVIGEFKILKKLIIYYGMNFYYRNSQVTLYNLYKNILVTFPIIAYGPLSILSSTYIYDTWIFQFYNLFYTSLPIIIFGLTDIKYSQYELSKNPLIYKIGQSSTFFNIKTIASIFVTTSFFGSLFVYVAYYATEFNLLPEGYMTFQIWSGMLVFNICVISVNIRIFMLSNQISLLLSLSVILSVLSYYLIFMFVGNILYSDVKNVLNKQLVSGTFWLVLLSMVAAIQIVEWTANKIFNENNKHLIGGEILIEQQATQKNKLNEEEQLPQQNKGKMAKRNSRSNDQQEFGKQISGGYAFAEDQQRSMHFI